MRSRLASWQKARITDILLDRAKETTVVRLILMGGSFHGDLHKIYLRTEDDRRRYFAGNYVYRVWCKTSWTIREHYLVWPDLDIGVFRNIESLPKECRDPSWTDDDDQTETIWQDCDDAEQDGPEWQDEDIMMDRIYDEEREQLESEETAY